MAKPTRVALLDGGAMFAKEHQIYWNSPSEKQIRMPSYSVLIDHADGLYLFDTGFDLNHFEQNISPAGAVQSLDQTLPVQLELLGLKPDAINYVVNSHFHFDHCGGNKHCVHAKTICHKCELESAFSCQPFEKIIYSDRSFVPSNFKPEVDVFPVGFESIEGDQEIAKGIHLFETPGHTLGHYSMMVKLSARKPMLFTGDVVYTQMGLDAMLMPTSHIDPVTGYKSMQRIKDIAVQYDAELFFAHDETDYESYLKAPMWYE